MLRIVFGVALTRRVHQVVVDRKLRIVNHTSFVVARRVCIRDCINSNNYMLSETEAEGGMPTVAVAV